MKKNQEQIVKELDEKGNKNSEFHRQFRIIRKRSRKMENKEEEYERRHKEE